MRTCFPFEFPLSRTSFPNHSTKNIVRGHFSISQEIRLRLMETVMQKQLTPPPTTIGSNRLFFRLSQCREPIIYQPTPLPTPFLQQVPLPGEEEMSLVVLQRPGGTRRSFLLVRISSRENPATTAKETPVSHRI